LGTLGWEQKNMKTLKQIQRLQKAHKLIKQENTGTPKEFAQKLHISERELYNIINHLKDLEANVYFNRKTNTYYYTDNFELLVNISVQVIVNEELRTIYAGSTILQENFLTARLVQ